MKAEPLDVIVGIVESDNLELTTIARSGVYLAYVQGTPEHPLSPRVDLPTNDLNLLFALGPNKGFGYYWGAQDLLEQHHLNRSLQRASSQARLNPRRRVPPTYHRVSKYRKRAQEAQLMNSPDLAC